MSKRNGKKRNASVSVGGKEGLFAEIKGPLADIALIISSVLQDLIRAVGGELEAIVSIRPLTEKNGEKNGKKKPEKN